MEYANRNNQNASKTNQQITSGKGKTTLVDNRTDFTSQAKLIDAIQRSRNGESNHVIQRVPIGGRGARMKWCRSCDDDRDHIHIRDVGGIGDTHAYQDADGRTRIGQQPAPDVEDENPILKHYMVVKNGTTYQLPVKHFYQPGYVGGDLPWIPMMLKTIYIELLMIIEEIYQRKLLLIRGGQINQRDLVVIRIGMMN